MKKERDGRLNESGKKSLRVRRELIRNLTSDELEWAAGGAINCTVGPSGFGLVGCGKVSH